MVEHCFTTRLGGLSEGMFESLNLSFTRGDDEEKVLENYKRVAEAIGAEAGQIVTTDQTHTTNVLRVGKSSVASGWQERDHIQMWTDLSRMSQMLCLPHFMLIVYRFILLIRYIGQ